MLGSVGLVQRFGQFYKSVDPGLVNINPCTETLHLVDVKIQIIPIGRQSVITRDNVNVEMYAIPHTAICTPADPLLATRSSTSKLPTPTAPRSVLATFVRH